MKKIFKISILILIIILITTAIVLLFISSDKKAYAIETRIEQLNEEKENDIAIIGWIKVQGTDIDYPIVKSEINMTEINQVFDRIWQSRNYKDGENRRVFYGHNYLNVSSEPLIVNKNHKRFEQLMSFTYYEFAKDNLYIQFTHDNVDELYKIYAITFLYRDEEDGRSYNKKELNDYIKKAKEQSLYDYNIDVNENDILIALMTCTRYFGTYGKTQFRIDARKVRTNEKIRKYSVEKSRNYDIIK